MENSTPHLGQEELLCPPHTLPGRVSGSESPRSLLEGVAGALGATESEGPSRRGVPKQESWFRDASSLSWVSQQQRPQSMPGQLGTKPLGGPWRAGAIRVQS